MQKHPRLILDLKLYLKKKPQRRGLPRKSGETFKNTPYIQNLQRQLSTIIKANNIFCNIKRSANKRKG